MIRLPGFDTREHRLQVPLDHGNPGRGTLEIFARELAEPGCLDDDRPRLLYLQGGPGGQSPRPLDRSGWLDVALRTHRVILLDQRGTGLSTPIGPELAQGRSAEELAEYLSLFRADAIVADAELLRRELIGDTPWETLGQSYGGFVTFAYLSQAPEGLRRCYVTGGVPGLTSEAAAVYRRTFDRVQRRNREYYQRYPQDVQVMADLVDHLEHEQVLLPDGDRLTPRRLATLGSVFGMSYGFETVHWLLDTAWAGGALRPQFLYDVMARTGFVDNVLYPLQEYTYGQGAATGWAAAQELARRPDFGPDARPVLFTAEMMFPWMFDEIRALRPFAGAADVLARKDDWPALYDLDRLAANEVPVVAAVYLDDLYVDADLQLDTLNRVPGCRAWVTNEHEHDGLRSSPTVLETLFELGHERR